jgi:CRISPR system Cascade subunit CasC
MFIELHIIQNFAPSNLNRSDTGSPKDCEFGGVRRARVSSQCFKRAIRDLFAEGNLFTHAQKASLAKRTRNLVEEITTRLVKAGKEELLARRLVKIALNSAGLEVNEKEQTEYLLFLGLNEIEAIKNVCFQYWEALMHTDSNYESARALEEEIKNKEEDAKSAPREHRQSLRVAIREMREKLKSAQDAAKKAIPKDIERAMLNVLNGGKAADLALFGRMVANLPDKRIDAAAQVAHAISTHKTGIEFDFYTAIDDLLPQEETGAGMMGTVEFNSACFYRYANVDVGQLQRNLDNDTELTRATIEAFIRAAIAAIPTGKQNSMAAQNPPSFVLAVVRESELWSLANAFVKPVRPTTESDVVETSIRRLDEYWKQLTTVYGDEQIREKAYINLSGEDLPNLNGAREDGVKKLIETISAAVTCQLEGQTR